MSSSEAQPIQVVLLWHMHQPEYRDFATGEHQLPWTYLHAIKDYVDMAAHLERHPAARAVVNFAPILLEQLTDYANQIDACLEQGSEIRDPLLNALISDQRFFANNAERVKLLQACAKANEQRLIRRFPTFESLLGIARQFSNPELIGYLFRQFFVDLVVWYHLAWIGETVRRDSFVVQHLMAKARNFTQDDRRQLLELIGDIISGVIPRYRALRERGQVELSCSPYAHPMLPLLIDFNATREALPHAPLPEAGGYPDGAARAEWHVEHGLRVFERHFGARPDGCWPSEGGLSTETVQLLDRHGFKWAASGDSVLRHSIERYAHRAPSGVYDGCRHVPFRLDNNAICLFFRDDGLSDLIGFNYSNWHADDAVGDLLNHIHNIRQHCESPSDRVVSIILDGENAWEYYPENGYYFLDALYKRLSSDPLIQLTTFGEVLKRGTPCQSLPGLVAGSWVYGNFATWMGDPFKNRAWDLLCDAKEAVDAFLAQHPEARDDPRLLMQLAVCEGSDWYWWFGDYNPAESVKDFDALFRHNLQLLYRLIQQEPPAELEAPLSAGSQHTSIEAGGVMRRGKD